MTEIDNDVPMPRLLNLQQTMDQLAVGRSSVYDLVATGKLTRIKMGKKICFLQAEVSEFIQKKFDEARQQQSRQNATRLEG